jgi:NADH:ubiquinone oxidoreductase subunit C
MSLVYVQFLTEKGVNYTVSSRTFLKSHDKLKFRQLIDIAGVDYPEEEKRFSLVYLLLSHEKNIRIKISINFKPMEEEGADGVDGADPEIPK